MVSARGSGDGGPRRTLRRGLIIAAVLVMALAVAAVAAFALRGDAASLGIDSGPDPKDTVTVFTSAWVAGDYRTMYRQLTRSDRAATRYKAFRRSYLRAADLATLKGMRVGGPERVVGGIGSAPLVLRTRLFGRLHAPLSIPLVRSGDRYQIDWSPQMTWPGLTAGERLARSSRAPDHRGAILSTDRSVLARGPADDRVYPQGEPYFQLTGYVSGPETAADRRKRVQAGWPANARYGQGGLEESLDDVLAGVPRLALDAVGPAGSRLIARRPGRRPHDVVTTLDSGLQATATAALGGRLGGIVIMDARNGAVRAAAGLGMDGRQPPGSTFKIVTASAALTAGTADLDSYYEPARFAMVGGFKLQNFHHELCGGSLIDAFAESCNSVFGPLAVATGARAMADTATRFGFNTVPHVRYPTPVSVMPRPAQLSSDVLLGVSGIGQGGVSATPLQMAQVAQVIAAHGMLRPAWLARQPHAKDDRSKPRRVLSRTVASKVATMMRAVVSYGTGTAAASGLATVNGKTGTAELGPGIKSDAWFVGYAPAEAPRVVVSVLIVHGGVGGETAAPIARAMIDAALG